MDISNYKAFTTEPKTRRHTSSLSISNKRCLEFMEHLWILNLRGCSYETLEFEFIQCFGTNEPRTIKRYLGIPEQLIKSQGSTRMLRMNRQSGKVAVFEYYNEKRIPAKKGLMEILGYITRYKHGNETRFRINHEIMPYYTQQTTLNEHSQAENNQESKESQKASKEDLRVCSLYTLTHSQINYEPNAVALEGEGISRERESLPRTERHTEIPNIEAEEIPNVEAIQKKEEESYRLHTHKSLTNSELCIQNRIQNQWIKEAEQLLTKIQQATLNTTKGETNE